MADAHFHHCASAVSSFFCPKALRILDANTVQYMIEEQQKELEQMRQEADVRKEQLAQTENQLTQTSEQLAQTNDQLARANDQLTEKDLEIQRLKALLAEKS